MRALTLFVVTLMSMLGGCAAVYSTAAPPAGSDGLLYYMPKRDILVTVTNSSGKITSITATASPSYADRTKSYLLDYQPHLLAKNKMDIEVSEAGLLTSSKANQTGDAVTALGGLGTLAGYLRASSGATVQDVADGGVRAGDAPSLCKQDGTHTFLFAAESIDDGPKTVCGSIRVHITRYGWTKESKPEPSTTQADGSSHAGIFYRVNLPYKVTMTSEGINAETIVHSPSESAPHFLPVARTLFSNNDAQITLANGAGVPSKYVQDTDGELAALLKLPAAIVSPYFAAIGQMFQFRSARRTQESGDMTSVINLELAKIKYQKCIDAIAAKDAELITALRCGG